MIKDSPLIPGLEGDWKPSYWVNDLGLSADSSYGKMPSQSNYDFIVIGGGITGLNGALELSKRAPKSKILLIERGYAPAGATVNSAGFACIGSSSELLDFESREGTEAMVALTARRLEGLKKLQQTVSPSAIEFVKDGNIEIFSNSENELFKNCRDNLTRLNVALFDATGEKDLFSIVDSEHSNSPLNANHFILNQIEGSYHPGKLVVELQKQLKDSGVEIVTGVSVTSLDAGTIYLTGSDGKEGEITGTKTLVATNAFANTLLPSLDVIKPGRGQVLITSPIKDLSFSLPVHIREGYDYARPVKDSAGNIRLMLGGGRDKFRDDEAVNSFGITDNITKHLHDILENILLPHLTLGKDYEIESMWSGIMGYGPTTSPIIKEVSSGIYCAAGMGGMGLALGTLIGQEAAEKMLS